MNDLNSVFLVGRIKGKITQEQEQDKAKKLSLTLASHHYTFSEDTKEYEEETGLYQIEMFGNQVEKLGSFLKEGSRVGVNGRMTTKNGAVSIIAYSIQFLDNASDVDKKGK